MIEDIQIRKLKEEDLFNGFLLSLDSLRKASGIEPEKAQKIFEKINVNPDHIIMVAVKDGKIIGASTLLIETKFIHNGSLVGHIEDVVIDKQFQGRGIGQKMVKVLLNIAKKRGCYKTILDCTDEFKSFYEKIGFKHSANALRFDH